MAAEAKAGAAVHVHHRVPRCLLGAWDRGHGPGLEPEDLAAWFEWEEEAHRYGVSPDASRRDLAATIYASAIETPGEANRAGHSVSGEFARWGRLGGLRTLARYGRPWFSLLGRRRWNRIGAETLFAYLAERQASKAGAS